MISLTGKGTDAERSALTFQWRFLSKPVGSVATLSAPTQWNPTFALDLDGVYELGLTVSDGLLSSIEDRVIIKKGRATTVSLSAPMHYDAWEMLQKSIDAYGSGATLSLDPSIIYVLTSAVDLRNFSRITIKGNGATILRAAAAEVSTTLAQPYSGTTTLYLTVVPSNYRVGDTLAIAWGPSVNEVTKDPRRIVAINGNKVTLNHPLTGSFAAGSIVFKSFNLIQGMGSHITGGSNPGVIIENVVFDGARQPAELRLDDQQHHRTAWREDVGDTA